MNEFPAGFGEQLGKELVYLLATKAHPSLSGNEWEEIFARCIGAEWQSSNVGLDDVALGNCAWGAKTISVQKADPAKKKRVRLIAGRNSPVYSFGETSISSETDPQELGTEVLAIWNARVQSVKASFPYVRTVVLLRKSNLREVAVFEFETTEYDPDQFTWQWNERENLEGYDKKTGEHRFTWQPHGSQFTIIEPVPEHLLIVKITQEPPKIKPQDLLQQIGFSEDWITVVQK